MSNHLSELLEESIGLELNVGKLYSLYANTFAEDKSFWMRLSLEEMNHAALLKSARQFLKLGKLPLQAVYPDMEAIKGMNSLVTGYISKFQTETPDKASAYQFAHKLESGAAEEHFQRFADSAGDDRVMEIFRKLAGNDLNHAKRIEELIKGQD